MSDYEGTFERTAEASLVALGASPSDDALDAWADPEGVAHALGELGGARTTAVLRAAHEPAGEGDAAAPAAPFWIRATKGSAEIVVGAAVGAAPGAAETRRVTRVVVDSGPSPDDADGAIARVSLLLDRKAGAAAKVLAAEVWARAPEVAVERVRAMATRLARALSVPASLPAASGAKDSGTTGDEEALEDAGASAAAPQVSVRALARFTLRGEGPRLVLRDFASRGPREGAGVNLAIGLGFTALAAACWAMFGQSTRAAGVTAAPSLAWLLGAVLLTLAATAFLGVARFARRYVATSAPLVAIGSGKVTVAPWVSREGAVVLEPEGRFGAAIDLAEVRGVSVQDREGRHAVEIATEHGPIDALITDDPTIARYLALALDRAIDDLRPQSTSPTARQRARKRAAAPSQ